MCGVATFAAVTVLSDPGSTTESLTEAAVMRIEREGLGLELDLPDAATGVTEAFPADLAGVMDRQAGRGGHGRRGGAGGGNARGGRDAPG
jgi:hypothetical protein